jgi:flavin-dependent dehydrogenase
MAADAERTHLSWDVPLRDRCDVLVVGGGSAGIAAAVAAARTGAGVVLVERYGFLGGTSTAAMVGPFMTSYSADGSQQLVAGVFQEVVDRMVALGGAVDPSQTEAGSAWASFIRLGHARVTPFHVEALKMAALEMVCEAGVKLRFHTSFVDVVQEKDRVGAVVTHDKAGLGLLRARVVVDASADGDVAAKAGAPFEVGRRQDGKMMPVTLFLTIGNVDDTRVEAWMREHEKLHPGERLFECIVQQAKARGEWDLPREYLNLYREPTPTTYPGLRSSRAARPSASSASSAPTARGWSMSSSWRRVPRSASARRGTSSAITS